MTMQQTLPMVKPNWLRRTLLADAALSALCAIPCLLDAKPLAAWLGISESFVLVIIGVGLLLFAADVAWIATRPQLDRRAATLILGLNIAWVVVSAILLLTDWVAFSSAGKWAIAGIADGVAVLAILEYCGLRQIGTNRAGEAG